MQVALSSAREDAAASSLVLCDFKDIKVTDNIIDNPDIVKGIGLLGHE